MRPAVPWSVKGIEPEAREAAKQAARRAGMTLGAWLNQAIIINSTDDVDAPPQAGGTHPMGPGYIGQPAGYDYPSAGQPSNPLAGLDLSPITDTMSDLIQRMDSTDQRVDGLLDALERQLQPEAANAAHAAPLAAPAPIVDPITQKLQSLSERIEDAERMRQLSAAPRAEDRSALMTLEKAVSAVVDHLENSNKESDQRFADIHKGLSSLGQRFDDTEAQAEAEKARKQTAALTGSVQTLVDRIATVESAVTQAAQNTDEVQHKAIDAALAALADKSDETHKQATITKLEQNLDDLQTRLVDNELRHVSAFEKMETSLHSLLDRIDQLKAEPQAMAASILERVEPRLNAIDAQLVETENKAVDSSQIVAKALADMQENFATNEQAKLTAISDNVSDIAQRLDDKISTTMGEVATRLSRIEAAREEDLRLEEAEAEQADPLSQPGNTPPPPVSVTTGAPEMPAPPPMGNARPSVPPHPSGLDDPFAAAVTPPPPGAVSPGADMRGPTAPPPPMAGDAPATGAPYPQGASGTPGNPAPGPMNSLGAQDFIAAARRAAMASQNGEAPSRVGFENDGHFNRYEDEPSNVVRKVLIWVACGVLTLILAVGLVSFLNKSTTPIAPQIIEIPKTDPALPGNSTATPPTSPDALVPSTTPSTPSSKQSEATPKDAGTQNAAVVPAPTSTPATAKPVATKRPKPTVKVEKGPRVGSAPVKPVIQRAAAPTLRQAASRGEAAAQYQVAMNYAAGTGVPQDFKQASFWLEKSANQGFAAGQYRLASLYEKGEGVAKDMSKAASWYEKAAAQGNVKAMHNLAVIHAEGRGVSQDFKEAAVWFEQAANHGLGDSQYNTAVLYERGLGVDRTPAKAFHWFAIAALSGDKGAAQKRDELANQLDAAALVNAKLGVKNWSAQANAPLANGDITSVRSWAHTSTAKADLSRAQSLLAELGYVTGPADGMMGPKTREAIRNFQQMAGLTITGQVDNELLKTLEAYLR